MSDRAFIIVPVGAIVPGRNAREVFSEEELLGLGQSMKDSDGPLQPLACFINDKGEHELIAGERRWRGAKLVGIESLPVIVRPKPAEKDLLKWNLVENLQREQLKPMETAKAVAALLLLTNERGEPVYSTRGLAEELGKGPNFIQNCENLVKAPEKVQEAVNEKKVAMEVGALLGTLPKEMHEDAIKEIIFRWNGPMDRDTARKHIADKYRRDLRKGAFDKRDSTVIAGVPACVECPHWGGKREDMEGKGKENVCLNPVCFGKKQEASAKVLRARAEEEGTRVLSEPDCRRIFRTWDNELNPDSGYVELDKKPDGWMMKDTPEAKKVPKWRKILEETGAKEVIAFDHEGRPRRLVEAKVALAAVEQTEYKETFRSNVASNVKGNEDRKVEMAVSKARNAAQMSAVVESLGDFHQCLCVPWTMEHFRLLMEIISRQVNVTDDYVLLCKVLKPDLGKVKNPRDQFEELWRAYERPEQLLATMVLANQVRNLRYSATDHGPEEVPIEDDEEDDYGDKPILKLKLLAEFRHGYWAKQITDRVKEAEKKAKADLRAKEKGAKKKPAGKVAELEKVAAKKAVAKKRGKVVADAAQVEEKATLQTPPGTRVSWISGGDAVLGEVVSRAEFEKEMGYTSEGVLHVKVMEATGRDLGLEWRELLVENGGVVVVASMPPKGGTPTSESGEPTEVGTPTLPATVPATLDAAPGTKVSWMEDGNKVYAVVMGEEDLFAATGKDRAAGFLDVQVTDPIPVLEGDAYVRLSEEQLTSLAVVMEVDLATADGAIAAVVAGCAPKAKKRAKKSKG